MRDDDHPDDEVKGLIELGSGIAGSAAGAALGFIAGGPPGAVVGGAAAGPVISYACRRVAGDLAQRLLSRREQLRVGATLGFALDEIRRRLESGEELRDDGFFEESISDRSNAEEVLEGLLLASQRSFEERKLQFLGRLYAGIAFDSTIDRLSANHLVRTAESLSFRQLLLLQYFAIPDPGRRTESFRGDSISKLELINLLSEIHDLYLRGLLNNGGEAMLGLSDLNPSKAQTQGIGTQLVKLMGLVVVEDAGELNRINSILNG